MKGYSGNLYLVINTATGRRTKIRWECMVGWPEEHSVIGAPAQSSVMPGWQPDSSLTLWRAHWVCLNASHRIHEWKMAIKIFCSIFCVILQCSSLRGGDESAAACVGAAHCHALLLAMESLDNLANLDNMDISVKVPPPLHSIFHEQAKSIVAIRVSSLKCYCYAKVISVKAKHVTLKCYTTSFMIKLSWINWILTLGAVYLLDIILYLLLYCNYFLINGKQN